MLHEIRYPPHGRRYHTQTRGHRFHEADRSVVDVRGVEKDVCSAHPRGYVRLCHAAGEQHPIAHLERRRRPLRQLQAAVPRVRPDHRQLHFRELLRELRHDRRREGGVVDPMKRAQPE